MPLALNTIRKNTTNNRKPYPNIRTHRTHEVREHFQTIETETQTQQNTYIKHTLQLQSHQQL